MIDDITDDDVNQIEQRLNKALDKPFAAASNQTGKFSPGEARDEFKKLPQSMAILFTRCLRGMTAEDLAKACEVEPRFITMLEKEEPGVPAKIVIKIRTFLELPDEIKANPIDQTKE